jgi:hypothetical protein
MSVMVFQQPFSWDSADNFRFADPLGASTQRGYGDFYV